MNRKRKNLVLQLRNDTGEWLSWDQDMKNLILDYFQSIYTCTCCDAVPILRNVNQKVTDEQNPSLLSRFEPREINEAIFTMHPDKSLGLDGMNPSFYQGHCRRSCNIPNYTLTIL